MMTFLLWAFFPVCFPGNLLELSFSIFANLTKKIKAVVYMIHDGSICFVSKKIKTQNFGAINKEKAKVKKILLIE